MIPLQLLQSSVRYLPLSFHPFLFMENFITFHSKVYIPLSPIRAVHMCMGGAKQWGMGKLPVATTTSVQK